MEAAHMMAEESSIATQSRGVSATFAALGWLK
jgi:hypothetical protein